MIKPDYNDNSQVKKHIVITNDAEIATVGDTRRNYNLFMGKVIHHILRDDASTIC